MNARRGAAWSALAAGAGALAVAGALLHRTLTVALEIRRYADDIADAIDEIAANTEVATDMAALRRHAGTIGARATAEGSSG